MSSKDGWVILIKSRKASNSICRMKVDNKEPFHLFYTNVGDDIKPAAFHRLMFHAKYRLEELMGIDDWDTEIGLDPIRWGRGDYWFMIDKINERNQLTWYWVKALLDLLDHCYSRGHTQEFEARLLFGSSKLARVRIYFYRYPDGDNALARR